MADKQEIHIVLLKLQKISCYRNTDCSMDYLNLYANTSILFIWEILKKYKSSPSALMYHTSKNQEE